MALKWLYLLTFLLNIPATEHGVSAIFGRMAHAIVAAIASKDNNLVVDRGQ